MKEHPLSFSPEMVQAILSGSKTQTLRVVKPSNSTVNGENVTSKDTLWTGLVWDERVHKDRGPHFLHPSPSEYLHVPWVHPTEGDDDAVFRVRCRYEIGDTLWVKERWWGHDGEHYYQADWPISMPPHMITIGAKWHSPMFMPRWANRITLEVINVRVQRIQDITEEDAIAEGCSTRDNFVSLWNALAKKGNGWAANSFCWCISFKRVEGTRSNG